MLVALATGPLAGAGGCGGSSTSGASGFGGVMLSFTVPGDVLIRSVDYTIDNDERSPLSGTIESPAAIHDLGTLIPHVPTGAYVVTTRAESTDTRSVCVGTTSIQVTKGATARSHVVANCKDGGHVAVGFGVDCRRTPLVDLVVSPLATLVGEAVLASAAPARADGGALTYAWSAPSGTFAHAKDAKTEFTCAEPGPVELTVQVTDAESCQQSTSIVVTCVPRPDGGAGDASDGD
jgi:hypothetical protein